MSTSRKTYTLFTDQSAVKDHLLWMLPSSPESLVCLLGLGKIASHASGGRITMCCPSHLTGHSDKSPSFGLGVDGGRVVYHCFGCKTSGDVFGLIALSRGLNVKTQFPAVLDAAARLVGYQCASDVRRALSVVRPVRKAVSK